MVACGGLDVWGNDESALMQLVVWLKHCFGVLASDF